MVMVTVRVVDLVTVLKTVAVVNYDEVVAGPAHLGEFKLHFRSSGPAGGESAFWAPSGLVSLSVPDRSLVGVAARTGGCGASGGASVRLTPRAVSPGAVKITASNGLSLSGLNILRSSLTTAS